MRFYKDYDELGRTLVDIKENRLKYALSASKILIVDIFFKLLEAERWLLIKGIQTMQGRLNTIESYVFSRCNESTEMNRESSISEVEIKEILEEIRIQKDK